VLEGDTDIRVTIVSLRRETAAAGGRPQGRGLEGLVEKVVHEALSSRATLRLPSDPILTFVWSRSLEERVVQANVTRVTVSDR
jgi:hypothetical protein